MWGYRNCDGPILNVSIRVMMFRFASTLSTRNFATMKKRKGKDDEDEKL